jgi:hypothetical protein
MNRSQMSKQVSDRGLWDNIRAKRERIAKGSGERMRKPGEKGAPTAEAIKKSQGKAKGGMVKYKNGGRVMANRGGDCKGTF